jgi:hypothetical protein
MKIKLTFVYVAFFALIGFAIWVTESAVPLWALLLTNAVPTFLQNELKENKNTTNEEIQN